MSAAASSMQSDNNDDEIQKSTGANLEDGPYACRSLHKLLGDGSTTILVKHSAPYMATKRVFTLNINRCIFEYKIISALQRFPPSSYSGIVVKTPKALTFSEANTTAIYEDFPFSIDLKSYLLTHQHISQSQAHVLGHALGLWTKKLHRWGAESEQEGLRTVMKGNHVMKDLKYYANYTRIIAKIEEYPQILKDSRNTFETIVLDAKKTFDSSEDCLIHGDFWTGNILLKNEPFSTMQGELIKLFVNDWELSHNNSFVFDLGQMFAELYQLKHFKNIEAGDWIISAFMQGYGKIQESDAFRVAIQVGTHFVAWGSSTPGWGTEEQILDLVTMGRDFIVNGWKSNEAYFEETPLWCLFDQGERY